MRQVLVRQSQFNSNGTVTSIPARNTEQPQLEKQGELFQWVKDNQNIETLEKEAK